MAMECILCFAVMRKLGVRPAGCEPLHAGWDEGRAFPKELKERQGQA